jgi:hypothetical protein
MVTIEKKRKSSEAKEILLKVSHGLEIPKEISLLIIDEEKEDAKED